MTLRIFTVAAEPSHVTTALRLQALPFVIETVGQKQRAAELHKRLSEVEEAMALFSRKMVLVQL